jgi:hypothetical protein
MAPQGINNCARILQCDVMEDHASKCTRAVSGILLTESQASYHSPRRCRERPGRFELANSAPTAAAALARVKQKPHSSSADSLGQNFERPPRRALAKIASLRLQLPADRIPVRFLFALASSTRAGNEQRDAGRIWNALIPDGTYLLISSFLQRAQPCL